jgi:hypothetical protein
MNSDVEYFRHKCAEASQLLAVTTHYRREFKVWTQPPYCSEVSITPCDNHISYTKEIRKNPRARCARESGQFLIKANYSGSIWLEHEGENVGLPEASMFLLKEIFITVAKPEH